MNKCSDCGRRPYKKLHVHWSVINKRYQCNGCHHGKSVKHEPATYIDPLLRFDPSDIDLMFEQSDTMDATPAYEGPLWPFRANHRQIGRKGDHVDQAIYLSEFEPDFKHLNNDELAHFLTGLRNAVLLPLNDQFIDGMTLLLEHAEGEGRQRVRISRRRDKYAGRDDAWERADLVAEIEAVAGQGRQRGREWWFNCPFHQDRTPSLHVDADKRVWHSFCCQRGGGALAWRKEIAA
jgi:hypothetical protein